MTMFFKIWTVITFAPWGGENTMAQFRECSGTEVRKNLDDYCPKLEGQTLERCCPKSVKRQCRLGTLKTMEVFEEGDCTDTCGRSTGESFCRKVSRQCYTPATGPTEQTVPVHFRGRDCCMEACKNVGDQEVIPSSVPQCPDSSEGGCQISRECGPRPTGSCVMAPPGPPPSSSGGTDEDVSPPSDRPPGS